MNNATLQIQVVAVRPMAGIGKASQKPYSFQVVDAVVTMGDGTARVAELLIEPKLATVEPGKRYDVLFEPNIDQQKRVGWRVVGVKVQAALKAA